MEPYKEKQVNPNGYPVHRREATRPYKIYRGHRKEFVNVDGTPERHDRRSTLTPENGNEYY